VFRKLDGGIEGTDQSVFHDTGYGHGTPAMPA
jgi:hypothetical protein